MSKCVIEPSDSDSDGGLTVPQSKRNRQNTVKTGTKRWYS